MRTTIKNRLGLIAAGSGVAVLAVGGLALPAGADEQNLSADTTATVTDVTGSLDAFQAWVTESLNANGSGNSVTFVEGPLIGGDALSGPIGSGNQTPIGSGNDTPVGSGNDVSAPIGSGNDASVDAPVGSDNDVTAPVDVDAGNGNDVGSGNETNTDTGAGVSVGDIGAGVGAVVDDTTSVLGLGGILR
jgi:hypothetical protein